MKNVYILGNWKSNKTPAEAEIWRAQYESDPPELPEYVTVIVCPAFHHLPVFTGNQNGFFLGVQDLSPFDSGAYTGAISGKMVREQVQYALLGHSERRKHFGESDEMVAQKATQAKSSGITPIVCVSEPEQARRLKDFMPDFSGNGLVLYEPLFAIGSGKADTPENANITAKTISEILDSAPILYGGSVTPENVKGFIMQEHLSGVGVGGASLDAKKFASLIRAVV